MKVFSKPFGTLVEYIIKNLLNRNDRQLEFELWFILQLIYQIVLNYNKYI